MATATYTLTPDQAYLLRREIIGMEYGRAAELLECAATSDSEDDLDRQVEAQATLAQAVALVEQFGGWGKIDAPLQVAADPEVIRHWALEALDRLADGLTIPRRDDAPPHGVAEVVPVAKSIAAVVDLLEEVGD